MAPVTRDSSAEKHVKHQTSKSVLPLILFTQQDSFCGTIAAEEEGKSRSGQTTGTAFQHVHWIFHHWFSICGVWITHCMLRTLGLIYNVSAIQTSLKCSADSKLMTLYQSPLKACKFTLRSSRSFCVGNSQTISTIYLNGEINLYSLKSLNLFVKITVQSYNKTCKLFIIYLSL